MLVAASPLQSWLLLHEIKAVEKSDEGETAFALDLFLHLLTLSRYAGL